MGISRMLRKVDAKLAARVASGERVEKIVKMPKLRKPRNGESYRAARRKEARETETKMIRLGEHPIDGSFDGSIELNRADRHVRAASYDYAREISHSKEPVR